MDAGESSSRSKLRRGRRSPSPNPAARLTDDLLVEILARVPYRSLCRFRCVSKHWRALIFHPDHRKTLPQSLVGFFHNRPLAVDGGVPPVPAPTGYCFTNVSVTGRPFVDPTFSFLPDRERHRLVLLDGCNGLVLCRSWRYPDPEVFDYLVLNPATEEWVAVPGSRRWSSRAQMVCLGFDPAFSHFYVFEFDEDFSDDDDDDIGDGHVVGVKIYSSKTGVWSHKQCGWSFPYFLERLNSVFLNGVLYVIAIERAIGAVDVEGKTWRIIDFPRSKDSPLCDTDAAFIGPSQGQLHFANTNDIACDELAIWVLEDKDGEAWTLKHTVRNEYLVEKKHHLFGLSEFTVVAIHPERNMVFFVFGCDKVLMSYDMDSRKVSFICNLGRDCSEPFFPYVHMFSKSLAGGDG